MFYVFILLNSHHEKLITSLEAARSLGELELGFGKHAKVDLCVCTFSYFSDSSDADAM